MGQFHELQADDPVRSRWCPGPLAVVLGVVGVFLGILALSALFAHPAGASTLAGSSGSSGYPIMGVVSDTAQSASAQSASAQSASAQSASAIVTDVVDQVRTAPSLQSLAPLVQPISEAIAAPVGQIVTALTSAPTSVTAIVTPIVQSAAPFGVEPGAGATTVEPVEPTKGTAANRPALGISSPSPRPLPLPDPNPVRPLQGFPPVTTSSPSADSSSSTGGSVLAATPVSGPLLPDPLVSGVIPEQSGIPLFLFDLRSSPPG